MKNILWVLNKYVEDNESNQYYPHFLLETQKRLKQKGFNLHFVFFSDNFSNNPLLDNKIIFRDNEYDNLSEEEIITEAQRIEKDYEFTFKQAYFADIIQTYPNRNYREITVPKKDFHDLDFLVPRFLFLENIISEKKMDIIFSDVSPEAEMEFGRAIGYKLNKLVFKSIEGSALGKTILFQSFEFGKDRLVEAKMNSYTEDEAKKFISDFIENRRLPYDWPKRNSYKTTFKSRLKRRISQKEYFYLFKWLFQVFKRKLTNFYYLIERKIFKPRLYDKYDPSTPYLFIGFHLNQESTMALRAQPYTNQTVLVEMISRVLPHNFTLYVRAHPHWPDTYSYKYLSKMKKFPGVKLISDELSIHDIIENSKGILTYNATTGIEALIYGKPVLSFASNIYNQHPSVDYCSDLFGLGKKLTSLINRSVNINDTVSYISKMNSVSIDLRLGSDFFFSERDSEEKAVVFSEYLNQAVIWCANNVT